MQGTSPEKTPINGTQHGFPKGSPLEALNEFYGALNHRDLQKTAATWATTGDATVAGPSGDVERGWPAIEEQYRHLFSGPVKARVELSDYSIHEQGDVFYMTGYEKGEIAKDGQAAPFRFRTTRIFVKSDGRWKQVHYHGSFGDPKMFAEVMKMIGPPPQTAHAG
ncbi:MAG TPA: nuclear transport factor 2 family protein [Candidatus Acidoferrales bacterium]|nr:nuclear transport factor 2 family protein [Candidatus Acidoferrales bacterium]